MISWLYFNISDASEITLPQQSSDSQKGDRNIEENQDKVINEENLSEFESLDEIDTHSDVPQIKRYPMRKELYSNLKNEKMPVTLSSAVNDINEPLSRENKTQNTYGQRNIATRQMEDNALGSLPPIVELPEDNIKRNFQLPGLTKAQAILFTYQ